MLHENPVDHRWPSKITRVFIFEPRTGIYRTFTMEHFQNGRRRKVVRGLGYLISPVIRPTAQEVCRPGITQGAHFRRYRDLAILCPPHLERSATGCFLSRRWILPVGPAYLFGDSEAMEPVSELQRFSNLYLYRFENRCNYRPVQITAD